MTKSLSPETPPHVQGYFDGILNGFLRGWAWIPSQPAVRLKIEIVVDGEVVGKLTADKPRGDLVAAGIGKGTYAFSWPLPESLIDNRHHEISVRWCRGKFRGAIGPEERKFFQSPPALNPDEDVVGFYDGINGLICSGWCALKPQMTGGLPVYLFLDEELLARSEAKGFRGDLRDAGLGDGRLGYKFRIPVSKCDGKAHTIVVLVQLPDGRFRHLKGSPSTIPLPNIDYSLQRTDRSQMELIASDGSVSTITSEHTSQLFRLGVMADATPVGIVVAVYNACEQTKACIESVLANTAVPYHLVLVNDASPDPAIRPMLEQFAAYPHITILHNKRNLGYTASINKGIQHCKGDVVCLNSDTEVTPFWLNRLRWAATLTPNVGTVTPFSNSAGVFSAPVGEDGPEDTTPIAQIGDRDRAGRLVARHSARLMPTAPTGNGFCLYIRRAVIDRIGLFDVENFGRGYGEENDFCCRATAAGFHHLVADDAYVLHHGSMSFGKEKLERLKHAGKKLDGLHPQYTTEIARFLNSLPMEVARERLGTVLRQAPSRVCPRLLFVLHTLDLSGTPLTTLDLASELAGNWEPWILVTQGKQLVLYSYDGKGPQQVARWTLVNPVEVFDLDRTDVSAIYSNILQRWAIELVHIRHFLGGTLSMPRVAGVLGIPVVVSVHDFFLICPNAKLLDAENKYCGGHCTAVAEECLLPRETDFHPPLKHAWVHKWREAVRQIFPQIAAWVTTSDYARQLHLQFFPELKEQSFRVIEHGRNLAPTSWKPTTPTLGTPIRCLALGNYDESKGLDLLLAAHALLSAENQPATGLTWTLDFLGSAPAAARTIGNTHGSYRRDEVVQKIQALDPQLILILSPWPETYCHTLTEAWAAGLPVIATDIGALGERVRRCGSGWTIPPNDAPALLSLIEYICKNPDEYTRVQKLAKLSAKHSTREMSEEYLKLYQLVLADSRKSAMRPVS